jgi:hypothetical protein
MSYGITVDQYWTGATGRALRRNKDARILSHYLTSGPGANMLGLYYLALPAASHDTGLTLEEVQHALEALRRLGFCLYDHDSELVWVTTMARVRLGLEPGESLKDGDKRIAGVKKEVQRLSGHPFAAMFVERYAAPFQLGDEFARQIYASVPPLERAKWTLNPALPRLLEGPQLPLASPFQGVPPGTTDPLEVRSGSDQDQGQDQIRGERRPPVRMDPGPDPTASGNGRRVEPDSPYNLLHVMTVVANRRRPELGLWSPGRFADRDAVDFYGQIPKGQLPAAVPLIRKRVEIFFDQPDPDGWPLKNFLDGFNALAANNQSPRRFDPSAEVR